MPTKTYFNLNKEKRDRIFQAALHEFSNVPFEKATIKNIIEEANIPKGSFYQYFEDIDDLYTYVLMTLFHDKQIKIEHIFEESNYDLFMTHRHLFIEELTLFNQNRMLYKHIFMNQNKHSLLILNHILSSIQENNHKLVEKMKKIDFIDTSMEYIIQVISLLQSMVRDLFFIKNHQNYDDETIIKFYDERVKIIQYGCLKEKEN